MHKPGFENDALFVEQWYKNLRNCSFNMMWLLSQKRYVLSLQAWNNILGFVREVDKEQLQLCAYVNEVASKYCGKKLHILKRDTAFFNKSRLEPHRLVWFQLGKKKPPT